MNNRISKADLSVGIDQLNDLCRSEYDVDLVELLQDPNKELTLERLRRMTGILIKRPFAEPVKVDPSHTLTQSNNSWSWNPSLLDDAKRKRLPEYQLLMAAAAKMPGSGPEPERVQELAERGVYKYFALWLKDKLEGEETKSVKQYLSEPESPEFESLLDLTDTLSQMAIGGVLLATLGVPGIVVSVSLIGINYGYRKLTEASDTPDY